MSITEYPSITHERSALLEDRIAHPRKSSETSAGLTLEFKDRLSSNVLALLDQAVVSGANFLTSVLVGRWCGLAELGAFALGCTVVVFALAIHEAFISSPYVVFLHRKRGADRQSYAGSVFRQFVLLVILIAAALALTGWTARFVTVLASFDRLLWLLAAVAPCVLLREFARRFAFAHFHWTSALLVDVGVSVLQIAGIAALGFNGALSAYSALAAVGASTAIGGIIWLGMNQRQFAKGPCQFGQDLREHWNYGRWLCADRVTSIAYNNAVPWLVAMFAGLTAAGGLAACLSVVAAANPVIMGLTNTLLPRTSRALAAGGLPAMRRELAAAAVLFTSVTVLFAGTVAVAGDSLLQFAYGDESAGYWPTLNVLAAALLVGMLSAAADFGLRTLEKSATSFMTSVVGLGIALVMVLALVPTLGALGAAYGVFAGEACASILCWIAFQRIADRGQEHSGTRRPCVEPS